MTVSDIAITTRQLATLIQAKTEGHPLFVTKLTDFLLERGDIGRESDHWILVRGISELEVEIPESVLGIIRRKLDALEEEDRNALTRASVIGREFSSAILASLLEADELDLSAGLGQFTLPEPKKKFKPKVNRTKSRNSNKPNMF